MALVRERWDLRGLLGKKNEYSRENSTKNKEKTGKKPSFSKMPLCENRLIEFREFIHQFLQLRDSILFYSSAFQMGLLFISLIAIYN